MFSQLALSEPAFAIGGLLLAGYFRLVRRTNRLVRIPEPSFFEPLDNGPVIIAMWHGENFLLPFFLRPADKVNVMVTLHRDGEFAARYGRRLGLEIVRGSGDHGNEFGRKNAIQAFMTLLNVLERGEHVALTADVPKVARVAGRGIVLMARQSGCPIVPVAMATSRRFRLSNWDRTCINLPFGRMVMVRGEPIRVPRDSGDAGLEAARSTVEERLSAITAQAEEIADR